MSGGYTEEEEEPQRAQRDHPGRNQRTQSFRARARARKECLTRPRHRHGVMIGRPTIKATEEERNLLRDRYLDLEGMIEEKIEP